MHQGKKWPITFFHLTHLILNAIFIQKAAAPKLHVTSTDSECRTAAGFIATAFFSLKTQQEHCRSSVEIHCLNGNLHIDMTP